MFGTLDIVFPLFFGVSGCFLMGSLYGIGSTIVNLILICFCFMFLSSKTWKLETSLAVRLHVEKTHQNNVLVCHRVISG